MATPDSEARPPEAEVEAPAVEAPVATPEAPSAVPADVKAEMSPPAREALSRLPVKEQGIFAQLRDKVRNPVEAAQGHNDKRRQLVEQADQRVTGLSGEQQSARAKFEASNQAKVRESQALERARGPLKELLRKTTDPKERKELERALAEAGKAATKAVGKASIEAGNAEHRAKVLQERIRVAQEAKKRLETSRVEAERKLDDALLRAVNSNVEVGRGAERAVTALDGRIQDQRTRVEQYKAQMKEFEGTAQQAVFEKLLGKAEDRLDQLENKRDDWKDQLDSVNASNDDLVSRLSPGRVETLLKDEKHQWVASLLSVEQIKGLDQTQLTGLLGVESLKVGLIKKLDAAKRLEEFKDVVGTRAELVRAGILEGPKLRAVKGGKGEGGAAEEGAESQELAATDWKARLERAKGTLEIALPDGLEGLALSGRDIAELAYDQKVASAPAELRGSALKLLVTFVKELLGIRPGEARKLANGIGKGGRRKFGEVVGDWNAAKLGPELAIPPELQGREVSAGVAKLELAKLVRAGGGDLVRVGEFMSREAAKAPAAATA